MKPSIGNRKSAIGNDLDTPIVGLAGVAAWFALRKDSGMSLSWLEKNWESARLPGFRRMGGKIFFHPRSHIDGMFGIKS